MNSNSAVKFLQRFPDRTINCGVRKPIRYGRWTCGSGKDPFTHLCVLLRAVLDQIYMSWHTHLQ